MKSENPELKEQLQKAIRRTVDLFNAIADISDEFLHPMDKSETCRDIHDIQNRIYTIAYKNTEFLDESSPTDNHI